MEITALGMIETSGLLSAIEAADAGLKAADVRLLGTDYVRGGLVMVRFEGDVAAVQAAVDAGTMAAQRIGNVVSSHVIPRAMPEVFCMLASDVGVGPAKMHNQGCAQCGGCEGGMRELRACQKAQQEHTETKAEHAPIADKEKAEHAPDVNGTEAKEAPGMPSMEELKTWKVVALRSFVRRLTGFPMKAADIRYANKKKLLTVLEEYMKNGADR